MSGWPTGRSQYSSTMAGGAETRSSGKAGEAPSRAFPELTVAELRALMAAFLIGRQQGTIAKFGALGQVVQRLSPDGSVQQLADVLVDTASGRIETAAARLKTVPLKDRQQAPKREEALGKLSSLARLKQGQRQF